MLDAPVEVLQRRKQEVTPKEGARQRTAYLKLMQSLPNSYIVDASQPLDEVVAKVKEIILDYISQYRQPAAVKKPSFPPALVGRPTLIRGQAGRLRTARVKGLLGRLSSEIKGLKLAITKRR
jgi:hypothetical protein